MAATSDEATAPVDAFFGTEGLKGDYATLRTDVLNRLIDEHPGIDMIDMILLERVAYAYARIRQREAAGMFGSERNYKAASTMLTAYMQEVRKSENREQLLGLIRADAMDVVVQSIKEAVGDLGESDQKKVMAKVLTLVHSEAEAEVKSLPGAASEAV